MTKVEEKNEVKTDALAKTEVKVFNFTSEDVIVEAKDIREAEEKLKKIKEEKEAK